jgi:hypothetical protein
MWDFSITTSPSEGAGIVAPGSTRHLEISLATICPSYSNEDRVSSSRLQGSQLPPEVSGMANSVSDDRAELSAASDFEAWQGNSSSMAARGVAEMTSKILSKDEEDDASLWRKKLPAARDFCGGSSEMMKLSWGR